MPTRSRMASFAIAAFLSCGLLAVVAEADPAVDGDDRKAIATVIRNQVAAFQQDDANEAFGYASSEIRSLFGTPDNFLRMVREQYPAVYRPQSLTLGELVERDGMLVQLASIVGPDGTVVTAAYVMQAQPDGSWRINGCYLLQSDDKMAHDIAPSPGQA